MTPGAPPRERHGSHDVCDVVVLGGGFGGMSAAKEFGRRLRGSRRTSVTLVDRHNYTLFTPMLPEAATGSVRPGSIAQSFRARLPNVRFELGEVVGIDETAREVRLRHPLTQEERSLGYRELLLAMGSTGSTFGTPGVERYALPLRTLADARQLRNAVLGAFEVASRTQDTLQRDRLSRFVIVGGGFTGIETAGELQAFAKAILPYYRDARLPQTEVVVVQREGRLLPHLPPKFGKHAARILRDRGIEIITNTSVEIVDAEGLTLSGGRRIEATTKVWAAGTEPAPIVKTLGLKTAKSGAVEVSSDFRVPSHPHLWAIGDMAAIPRKGGGTYAPLAQNAVREGPLAARNILAVLAGRKTKAFRYRERGQMAALGDRNAIADIGGKLLTGTPAWLLWRWYYLDRLPSFAQRCRVALDWAMGTLFVPNASRLPMTADATSFGDVHAAAK